MSNVDCTQCEACSEASLFPHLLHYHHHGGKSSMVGLFGQFKKEASLIAAHFLSHQVQWMGYPISADLLCTVLSLKATNEEKR